MYLEIFLADFTVFRVFLGISRDFAEIPEFRGSATARNIRSPGSILWLKMAPSDTNNFNHQKARVEFFLILWCILCPKEITFLFLAHKLWRLYVEFECVN